MREWNLAPGDPLALTLAADFRFTTPDYSNDHIWELELGGGDPPALGLRTTYGLRANQMRIFPRFHIQGQVYADPAVFIAPPCLRRFAPNYLLTTFSPCPGLEVTAEYWVSESHAVAGRLEVANRSAHPLSVLLEVCGQLIPHEGGRMRPMNLQAANILAGECGDLAPVLFLTGGAQFGAGAYPSLVNDLALAAGGVRTVTWVQSALSYPQDSFEHARQIAARNWEAERTRIELTNTADTVEIHTGNPDWDAAFALSQKTAFRLFMGPSPHLPMPSCILTRQPDQGWSRSGDGRDQPAMWRGVSPMEAYYLANLVPGAPHLAEGVLRNFLAVQEADGFIDTRPGLAGQRSRHLASPFLTSLCAAICRQRGDDSLLIELFAKLLASHRQWFTRQHDRDGDGIPEWDHPSQAGLEDHPGFNLWSAEDQGADITFAESPALASLLLCEARLLTGIADKCGDASTGRELETEAARLEATIAGSWNAKTAMYHYRDRETHVSQRGSRIAIQRGAGVKPLKRKFKQPVRLLVQVASIGNAIPRPEVCIQGARGGHPCHDLLMSGNFTWGIGRGAVTTRETYTSLSSLEVRGAQKGDTSTLLVMDYSMEDASLFLPLWAQVPDPQRAADIVDKVLFHADRFGSRFGAPLLPAGSQGLAGAVHLPWNLLIGEGLLAYDMRPQAARLVTSMMSAVIKNLKQQRAFARAYQSGSGVGLGERNALHGLAPLGLFLQTLGVLIRSPREVLLSGKNPYPWTVTVQYRGLVVTREAAKTTVIFPDGQSYSLDDPTDAVITAG